ncbi:DUF2267 domain-containing protein [Yinghuangia sp. ASG 101]|uniref:DUF2267 domain-containing protein n=1 Tax=Yinghuangia sp. ASG 101 TaxID=2896848 RepID=UPI001E32F6E9|nr:DUF2267 domain-containing protein [Yinghuangia sp. ASG 101]UGQ12123.1 DUF2267 domain-containing protein [Yinghuangia sp. ASG 101]
MKERGEYHAPEEAERATRVLLALVGAHLVGDIRAQPATRLPEEFALIPLNPPTSAQPPPRSGSNGKLMTRPVAAGRHPRR